MRIDDYSHGDCNEAVLGFFLAGQPRRLLDRESLVSSRSLSDDYVGFGASAVLNASLTMTSHHPR